MALRSLHKISCTIFPSACGCRTVASAVYCTPISTKIRSKAIPISAVRLSSTSQEKQPTQLTFKDKAANLFKTYGKLAIITYTGVYLSTLGSMFFLLEYDVLNSSSFGLDPSIAIEKVRRFICIS